MHNANLPDKDLDSVEQDPKNTVFRKLLNRSQAIAAKLRPARLAHFVGRVCTVTRRSGLRFAFFFFLSLSFAVAFSLCAYQDSSQISATDSAQQARQRQVAKLYDIILGFSWSGLGASCVIFFQAFNKEWQRHKNNFKLAALLGIESVSTTRSMVILPHFEPDNLNTGTTPPSKLKIFECFDENNGTKPGQSATNACMAREEHIRLFNTITTSLSELGAKTPRIFFDQRIVEKPYGLINQNSVNGYEVIICVGLYSNQVVCDLLRRSDLKDMLRVFVVRNADNHNRMGAGVITKNSGKFGMPATSLLVGHLEHTSPPDASQGHGTGVPELLGQLPSDTDYFVYATCFFEGKRYVILGGFLTLGTELAVRYLQNPAAAHRVSVRVDQRLEKDEQRPWLVAAELPDIGVQIIQFKSLGKDSEIVKGKIVDCIMTKVEGQHRS